MPYFAITYYSRSSVRNKSLNVVNPISVAIADNLGRVIIVDVDHFQVVRLFKGYRQAALAWYTATHYREHSRRNQQHAQRRSKKDRQVALFLVIHAPKRALVEVWPIMCFKGSRGKKSVPMQSSQRAAAFNVSKYVLNLVSQKMNNLIIVKLSVVVSRCLSVDSACLKLNFHFHIYFNFVYLCEENVNQRDMSSLEMIIIS